MGFQIVSKCNFRTLGSTLIVGLVATISLSCSTVLAQGFRARPSHPHAGPPTITNRVAPVESKNFVVYANDATLAKKVSREAERFRKQLAIEWLGKEIPDWQGKCPITVEIAMNAGGETSFAFIQTPTGAGTPIDWKMKIYGPPNRLLDAVLPHEITHTIFATHFGRPLPRWADEGACTTVEHESERRKNHKMLLEFLTAQPSRGIPFNRMFTMRNYPHDILPLYAQGYSLARFLIMKKGKHHFVNYVAKGLQNESRMHELRAWDSATNEFYQFDDLSDLQIDWLRWVKDGSHDSERLASSTNTNNRVQPSVYLQNKLKADQKVDVATFVEVSPLDTSSTYKTLEVAKPDENQKSGSNSVYAQASLSKQSGTKVEVNEESGSTGSGSWYAREMKKGGNRVASKLDLTNSNETRKVPADGSPSSRPPAERDSRLPGQYRTVPPTMWR